jgi:hypothetical protein
MSNFLPVLREKPRVAGASSAATCIFPEDFFVELFCAIEAKYYIKERGVASVRGLMWRSIMLEKRVFRSNAMQDNTPNNEIIIYEGAEGQPRVEVRMQGDTVWLSQSKIAELFGTTRANISIHAKNIFEEGELAKNATVKEYLTVQKEGDREVSREIEHYNLELILSIGYRVKSPVATHFRQWATARLKEYIVKGFAMDDERLKNLGDGGDLEEA